MVVMAAVPSDELVLVQWLRSLPGLSSSVSTSLPSDSSTWAASGFVQVVGSVGGTPNPEIPFNESVLSIDTWANTANSNRPPWPIASKLIEQVRWALWSTKQVGAVALPAGYEPAAVHTIYALTHPRRLTDDPLGYAHFSMDVQMNWNVLAVVS